MTMRRVLLAACVLPVCAAAGFAAYVAWLSEGNLQDLVQPCAVQGRALSNATIQLRLTTVRLFYDYLVEEGQRIHSPVGRGRYTPGNGFGGQRVRGLVPRFKKIPWIPIRYAMGPNSVSRCRAWDARSSDVGSRL